MSKSKDQRSRLEKLQAMANDPSASLNERQMAYKAAQIILDAQAKERAERLKDLEFMASHGFRPRPSADPLRPNAGWQYRNRHESDSGELRKRDYKSPPRYQRGINRDAWINLQAEARARAQYEDEYLLGLFGKAAGDLMTAERNRQRLKTFINTGIDSVYIKDNICLINATYTKRLLFWTHSKPRHWYIVERDTITGKTQRSKKYNSREGALFAHNSDQITWQRCEYT